MFAKNIGFRRMKNDLEFGLRITQKYMEKTYNNLYVYKNGKLISHHLYSYKK